MFETCDAAVLQMCLDLPPPAAKPSHTPRLARLESALLPSLDYTGKTVVGTMAYEKACEADLARVTPSTAAEVRGLRLLRALAQKLKAEPDERIWNTLVYVTKVQAYLSSLRLLPLEVLTMSYPNLLSPFRPPQHSTNTRSGPRHLYGHGSFRRYDTRF